MISHQNKQLGLSAKCPSNAYRNPRSIHAQCTPGTETSTAKASGPAEPNTLPTPSTTTTTTTPDQYCVFLFPAG